MNEYGFLAIWCDIAASDLNDYRNWLTQEHIADRTFLPGFLGVRLFEGLDDPCSHFILYATKSVEVLNGSDYRAVLDNPSPWTRRIMPKFGPFDRALGRQTLKIGNGFGPCITIWRLKVDDPTIDTERMQSELEAFRTDGIVSLRVCALSRDTTDRHSKEKTMRGSIEGDFDFLICAEALNDRSARQVEARLSRDMRRLFPALVRSDNSCRRMIYGEAAHEGATGRVSAPVSQTFQN